MKLKSGDVVAMKSFHGTYVSWSNDSFYTSWSLTETECFCIDVKNNLISFSIFSTMEKKQVFLKDGSIEFGSDVKPFYFEMVDIEGDPTKIALKVDDNYVTITDDGYSRLATWIREWEMIELVYLNHPISEGDTISLKTSFGEYVAISRNEVQQTLIQKDAKWVVKSEIPGKFGFWTYPGLFLAASPDGVHFATDMLEYEHFTVKIHMDKVILVSFSGEYITANEDGRFSLQSQRSDQAKFQVEFIGEKEMN